MGSVEFTTDFRAAHPRYFQTNDPLSSDDASKFNEDVIAPAIANLIAIDGEIAHLIATVSSLRAQRSRLHSEINGYLMRRSAFHHFPPEILANVFYWVGLASTSILCTRQAPWVLAQVCTRWRRIVFTHPVLWTRISIEEKDRGRRADCGYLLKRAVAYSGALPLQLCMEMPDAMWVLRISS